MNKDIILKMVEPYIKDTAITYEQFESIFSMLSKKEQYAVVELLYDEGVNLVDKQIDIDEFLLNENLDDSNELSEEEFEILYDDSIFKDADSDVDDILLVNKDIRQSNENLCYLIQQGNKQAEQDLCIKNKKLVDKYVSAYQKKYGHRMEFDDLEQVGYIGLLEAAMKYDSAFDTVFSTYAVFWIKQRISREIMNNGSAIRIPVHMIERVNKVAAVDSVLYSRGIELDDRIKMISEELFLSIENVKECMRIKRNYLSYVSLDAPIAEDEDSLLVDFIPDENMKSLDEEIDEACLRSLLLNALDTLSEREKRILVLRFGLEDDRPRTLEEVGREFGLTRERIRQIEAKALRKMRHLSRSKKIKEFL